MSRTCSICTHAQVERIDAHLAAGEPTRGLADQFGVSRSSLVRHGARHLAGNGSRGSSTRDPFKEGKRLLGAATTARQRLRALEAIRAADALDRHDHARTRTTSKKPSESQWKNLTANRRQAWQEYEGVLGGGDFEAMVRALQGAREAERAYRTAAAQPRARGRQPVSVTVTLVESETGETHQLGEPTLVLWAEDVDRPEDGTVISLSFDARAKGV